MGVNRRSANAFLLGTLPRHAKAYRVTSKSMSWRTSVGALPEAWECRLLSWENWEIWESWESGRCIASGKNRLLGGMPWKRAAYSRVESGFAAFTPFGRTLLCSLGWRLSRLRVLRSMPRMREGLLSHSFAVGCRDSARPGLSSKGSVLAEQSEYPILQCRGVGSRRSPSASRIFILLPRAPSAVGATGESATAARAPGGTDGCR